MPKRTGRRNPDKMTENEVRDELNTLYRQEEQWSDRQHMRAENLLIRLRLPTALLDLRLIPGWGGSPLGTVAVGSAQ